MFFCVIDSFSQNAPVTTAGNGYASPGSQIIIPLTVAGFSNISSVSLRLEYDPAVITFNASLSSINHNLEGSAFINSLPVGGGSSLYKIMVTWMNTTPKSLPNYDTLVYLNFLYTAETCSLTFNNTSNGGQDCEYSNAGSNPLIDQPTSGFYINGAVRLGMNITGTFIYNNSSGSLLDSLWVILKQNGVKVDSARTNLNGQYSFVGKTSNTYTIGAVCTKPWGGVNSTDAIKVERHFVGAEPLTVPVKLLAGDVNNTNYINATDASKIKRRFVGLENSFARGDWVFAKPTGGDTVIVAGTNVVQDFQGLCVGDVNGSYIPNPGDAALADVSLINEGIIEVMQGDEFELPVRIMESAEISAISLTMSYPQDNLQLLNISISQGNVLYAAQNGQIRIAWSQIEPMNIIYGEVLLTLKFRLSFIAPLSIPIMLNIGNESELADGWGEPISNSMLSVPSVLPVKPTGVNETSDMITKVALYPNPATSKVWLEFELTMDADILVEWFNVVGELMNTVRFDGLSNGKQKMEMDVSGFGNGVYTLKTIVNGRSSSMVYHKLVISK